MDNNTIKVRVPDMLYAYKEKQAVRDLIKAFSCYYQQLLPSMPVDRKDSLVTTATNTCDALYDLLTNYVYNGRTKKTINIPFDSGFDHLVEDDSTQTTVLIINRAWDCYLHENNIEFTSGEVFEKLQWTLLRDGICALVIAYGLEYRTVCAEQFYKEKCPC